MADEVFDINLPADLPEEWNYAQVIAPTGEEAGLTKQHGYNYLNKQINDTQKAVNELGAGSYTRSQVDTKLAGKASTSHTHTKSDVGLGNVDNTADSTKTVQYANYPVVHSISGSTNLNNLTTSGLYYCPANATVQTLTNCPTKNAFLLEVGRHAGAYQHVTEYMTSGAKSWYRNYYGGTWGSWYRIYSESDAPAAATTSAAGLMSAADKTKLNGIASGANAYSLPTATASVLGGVKTGSNITNSSGTISLTKANVTAALGYTPPTTNTTYGAATSSALGLVKTGSNITNSSGTISLTKANVTSALGYTPPTTNTTYGAATTSAAGLMSAADKAKLDGIASGATAGVTVSASGTGYVRYSNGLQICWGNVSNLRANLTLPAAFKDTSYGFATLGKGTGSYNPWTYEYSNTARTTTTLDVNQSDSGSSASFSYIAVGLWK